MKRIAIYSALFALLLAAPALAETHTYFGFNIGISNAPPPPPVRFYQPPPVVLVPNTSVYVVENPWGYDMFRYGGFFYVADDGYWYRAHSYRGPFVAVDARYVPHPIYSVPPGHWRHDWRNNEDAGWHGQDRGNGYGHGHGRGHGHGNHGN